MVVKRLSPPVFEQAFEGYVLACEAMVGDLDMFTGGADVEVIEVFDEALAFFLKHARAHNSWRKITEALNLNILAGAGRLPSKGARSLKRIAQTLAKRPAPASWIAITRSGGKSPSGFTATNSV